MWCGANASNEPPKKLIALRLEGGAFESCSTKRVGSSEIAEEKEISSRLVREDNDLQSPAMKSSYGVDT